MFSQLGDKLQDIFKDLRGHGTISEANINDALRQVRLALLEADVDFQVAKQFIARIKEKALGERSVTEIFPRARLAVGPRTLPRNSRADKRDPETSRENRAATVR